MRDLSPRPSVVIALASLRSRPRHRDRAIVSCHQAVFQVPAASADVERRLLEAVRRSPTASRRIGHWRPSTCATAKLDAALPHLERAQAIDPAQYANGYDLALVLLQTGKLSAAREQVDPHADPERHGRAPQPSRRHRGAWRQSRRRGRGVSARRAHGRRPRSTCSIGGTTCVQLRAFEPATQVFTAAIERAPEVGAAPRRPGHRAVLTRAVRGRPSSRSVEAADLAPSDPRPYQFLGEMYGVAPELGERRSPSASRVSSRRGRETRSPTSTTR